MDPVIAASPNLAAQHAYVEKIATANFKFGLTVGDAFVRGIRDLGYKSNGNALAELVDNSIQAGADRVDVAFGFEGTKSDKKPSEIAVIDNGHGMEPGMIRLAVMWGGTHREGDRSGMGRYGYGLPCASVSIGQRFTVYSKVLAGDLSAVTIDLKAITAGLYTDDEGDIVVPEPRAAKLPKFVADQIKKAYPDGWRSGTVVVLEQLDRVEWSTANGLRENLLRHFGVAYHKMRDRVSLFVAGDYVEPIDPLFLTDGFRWFDLDEDRARAFEPVAISVKDVKSRDVIGTMTVRMAWFPPTFASVDKRRGPDKRGGATEKNANARFNVMRDYHGILFSRMGRLIDVVGRPPWTTFQNNDRYIKVEVEFSAALDEEFGITTSKQQVTVSERIWEALRQAGIPKAIEQLRGEVNKLKEEQKRQSEAPAAGEQRPSEDAMSSAKASMREPSLEVRARQQERGALRLQQAADERAKETGETALEAKAQLEFLLQNQAFKVDFESSPGGLFFRAEMMSGTKVLYLNRAHRFYQDVYDGPKSSPEVRAALEVLLLAIGDSILDAPDESQRMYRVELPNWSLKLDLALERLAENVGLRHDGQEPEPAWEPIAAE